MTDEQMAERIAAEFNDRDRRMRRWASMSAEHRAVYVERWERRLEAIRAAGFEIVEAEDGR